MPITRFSNLLLILAGALALSALAVAQPADNRPAPAEPGRVEVAMLTYGSARITSVCFSDKFLELVRRQTSIRVHDEFAKADLATDSIFDYPLLIMTGEGAFELTDDEVTRLRSFLSRGGILLASAGCSNERWNESMRRTLERVLPASEPVELGMDHPMFTSLYQVSSLEGSRYKGAAGPARHRDQRTHRRRLLPQRAQRHAERRSRMLLLRRQRDPQRPLHQRQHPRLRPHPLIRPRPRPRAFPSPVSRMPA
ncbi:MAG: DUF4159 domain-containing protein [Phycisphaerales bacterium]